MNTAEPRLVEADLKPCPFCGHAPTIYLIPPHQHNATGLIDLPPFQGATYIECNDCDLVMSDSEAFDLVTRWNARQHA